jgi:hypothetical protein
MKFIKDQFLSYGEVRRAGLDNDVAFDLMGKFAVHEDGIHYTPEEWAAFGETLDFPVGFMELFREFQRQTIIPTMRSAT